VDELSTQTDADSGELADLADEPPVVARLVVEIRSDGTRTIARGAVEDRLHGEQVAVEASAGSPLELSRALAKMLLSMPFGALIGARPPSEPRPEPREPKPPTLVRATVGALGRRLGRRLDRALRGDDSE
jgi:hypothetical protein